MSLFVDLTQKEQDARLYRIIEPQRLYELFERNEGVLVHPSCWDDPYENFILRSKVRDKTGRVKAYTYHENLYGQCWTLNPNSDAMWRIYSPDTRGIRIRTTVRNLFESLYYSGVNRPDMFCVVGKVRYLGEKALRRFANGIYKNGSLEKDKLFRTLLVKRPAFRHEKEVRLLYFDDRGEADGRLLRYRLKAHDVIDQIMIDPRVSYAEFKQLKEAIQCRTEFQGPILRSLLYSPPEETILEETAA